MAKNPDYTESAINLVNPEEVVALMAELALQQVTLESRRAKTERDEYWKDKITTYITSDVRKVSKEISNETTKR